MDVSPLVRLPNGDQVVMDSTPTFHNGIYIHREREREREQYTDALKKRNITKGSCFFCSVELELEHSRHRFIS